MSEFVRICVMVMSLCCFLRRFLCLIGYSFLEPIFGALVLCFGFFAAGVAPALASFAPAWGVPVGFVFPFFPILQLWYVVTLWFLCFAASSLFPPFGLLLAV